MKTVVTYFLLTIGAFALAFVLFVLPILIVRWTQPDYSDFYAQTPVVCIAKVKTAEGTAWHPAFCKIVWQNAVGQKFTESVDENEYYAIEVGDKREVVKP